MKIKDLIIRLLTVNPEADAVMLLGEHKDICEGLFQFPSGEVALLNKKMVMFMRNGGDLTDEDIRELAIDELVEKGIVNKFINDKGETEYIMNEGARKFIEKGGKPEELLGLNKKK